MTERPGRGVVVPDDGRAERCERLRSWLADHPGSTKEETARALGLSPAEVLDLLGPEAPVLLVDQRPGTASYSEDDLLEALRSAAVTVGDPLAADAYERHAQRHGFASAALVIQRFGTWNAACAAAGLSVRETTRTYTRRWSTEEMAEALADYLSCEQARGSYADYAAWASSTDGAPSGQTVRNAFGGWTPAKTAGQEALARRRSG